MKYINKKQSPSHFYLKNCHHNNTPPPTLEKKRKENWNGGR